MIDLNPVEELARELFLQDRFDAPRCFKQAKEFYEELYRIRGHNKKLQSGESPAWEELEERANPNSAIQQHKRSRWWKTIIPCETYEPKK